MCVPRVSSSASQTGQAYTAPMPDQRLGRSRAAEILSNVRSHERRKWRHPLSKRATKSDFNRKRSASGRPTFELPPCTTAGTAFGSLPSTLCSFLSAAFSSGEEEDEDGKDDDNSRALKRASPVPDHRGFDGHLRP